MSQDSPLAFFQTLITGAIGFALLWYDFKRDEQAFRYLVREEIERALKRHDAG